ncbi:MAG: response regulator [Bdellovibrionaceae bacterium]|nr:response regulator [Pseudobdellovibrionaceae bacterium]
MRSYKAKAQVNWNWNTAQRAGAPRLKTKHRILIADDDLRFARSLADYLWEHGFDVRVTKTISEAKELVEFWQPDSVFVDLLLPETNALSLFKFIRTHNLKKTPKLIVMSKQAIPQGIEQMRRAGASHYLVKPFAMEEAFRVVQPEIQPQERRENLPELKLTQSPSTIKELHLINLFLKQATLGSGDESSLYNLMRMINLKSQAIRTSLVQFVDEHTGAVLASNDDESVQGLALNLEKYPEFREVRRREATVVISNVRTSDILTDVKGRLAKTPFETLVLFPVYQRGRLFGVLSVRLEQKEPLEIFYIEKFGQVCSQIISLAITSPGQSLLPG